MPEHCAICLQRPELTAVGGGQEHQKPVKAHYSPPCCTKGRNSVHQSLTSPCLQRSAQRGCELNELEAHSEYGHDPDPAMLQASTRHFPEAICWGFAGCPSSEPQWHYRSIAHTSYSHCWHQRAESTARH